MVISNWPKEDRPREKLLLRGAKHLSDTELLAIFIRTGIRGKSALDVARELLTSHGTLKNLLDTPLHLMEASGLGPAKYATLKAAQELGSRYQGENLNQGKLLKSSRAAKHFLQSRLSHYPHEVFACLFLDSKNRLIVFEELFQGTVNESNVYPREIAKKCLMVNAVKIILAHNHPSKDPTPSPADIELTLHLKATLDLLNITILDHIVVGGNLCASFADLGLL